MKSFLFGFSAVMAASIAFAATDDGLVAGMSKDDWAKLTPVERKAKIEYRMGGKFERPGSKRGKIVVVNCQKTAPQQTLNEGVKFLIEQTGYDIVIKDGMFEFPNPKLLGEINIFVVDDAKLPSILHAPEDRWVMVNVSRLSADNGSKPAFFAARVQKELTRGFLLAGGSQDSNYPNSIMGAKTKPSDLDKHLDCRFPVDIMRRLGPYLSPLGVTPSIKVSYMAACQEGWAAKPTNEVQKAIWNKVHEIPTEPMVIKPEKHPAE